MSVVMNGEPHPEQLDSDGSNQVPFLSWTNAPVWPTMPPWFGYLVAIAFCSRAPEETARIAELGRSLASRGISLGGN